MHVVRSVHHSRDLVHEMESLTDVISEKVVQRLPEPLGKSVPGESPEKGSKCIFQCSQCLKGITEDDAVYMLEGVSYCSNQCRCLAVDGGCDTPAKHPRRRPSRFSMSSDVAMSGMCFWVCLSTVCALGRQRMKSGSQKVMAAQKASAKPNGVKCSP
mmetsp:Transcript_50784/g.135470  ORF Transcript_50784/g.135470 Transcript_50784/m.135470 type:complete len:157 (-) Transcript_50784:482-952(-)